MAGLLLSFAKRWEARPEACAVIPFERVYTGRMPNPEDYPFPCMSILPGHGRQLYRSDKRHGYQRDISLHVWTDPARLEEDGERVMELVRQIYANRAWTYDYGRVIDVLDRGPPFVHQTTEATVQYWELVKLISLCIEVERYDVHDHDPDVCQSSEQSWSSAKDASSGFVFPASSSSSLLLPSSASGSRQVSGSISRAVVTLESPTIIHTGDRPPL